LRGQHGVQELAEAFAQTPTLTIFVVIAGQPSGCLSLISECRHLPGAAFDVDRPSAIALPYVQHAVVRARQRAAALLAGPPRPLRTCHVAISARYPAVELGTAVGFGLVAWAVGIRPAALALSLCWALGIVVSGIDLDGLAAGFVLLVLLWIGPVALVVISLVDANASRGAGRRILGARRRFALPFSANGCAALRAPASYRRAPDRANVVCCCSDWSRRLPLALRGRPEHRMAHPRPADAPCAQTTRRR